MWGSLVVVATIFLAAAGAVSTMPRSGCSTGAIIRHDCNTCICDEDRTWACTKMRCPRSKRDAICSSEEMENPLMKCACVQKGYGSPEDRAQCLEHESGKEFRLQRSKRSDQVCEPGTTFMRDCNICKCSTQGDKEFCTRKICHKRCRPGTLRFADCNSCLCHQGGWKCTKRACPKPRGHSRCQLPKRIVQDDSFSLPEDPTHLTRRAGVQCEEGTHVVNVLQLCECGPNNTLVNCVPLPRRRREYSCTPGTTFMDECNTCWCAPDGKTAACTRMDCPPGSY